MITLHKLFSLKKLQMDKNGFEDILCGSLTTPDIQHTQMIENFHMKAIRRQWELRTSVLM